MSRQTPHRVSEKMSTRQPVLSTRQKFFWGKPSRQVVDIFRCPLDNFEQLSDRARTRNRQTQTTSENLPFKFWKRDEKWSLVQLVDGTFGWLPNVYIQIIKSLNYWGKIKFAEKNKLTPLPRTALGQVDKILHKFERVPYLWGGTTETGMDCSAFVQKFIFELGGILLPRNSREQKKRGRLVCSVSTRQRNLSTRCPLDKPPCPLDILFFVHSTTSRHHVGVYWGDKVVHFCLDKRGLTTESLDSIKKRYDHIATRRIFKLLNA